MANVFISYERSAEALVRKVREALIAAHHTVWSDGDLPPHRSYAEVIEERLSAADAVLVLWSAAAARSQWVRAEAEHARHEGKLVQLTLDGSLPPMPFNQIQCAPLQGWNGDRRAPGWLKVLASLDEMARDEKRIAAPPTAPIKAAVPTPPLRRIGIIAGLAVVGIAVVGGGVMLLRPHAAPAVQGRIAILPFETLSDTPSARDIAKELGDQMLTAFNGGQIPVVSQENAAALSGPGDGARARSLGVALTLGGTVQDDGKSVDIKVRLDDPSNRATVWTGNVHGDATNADALQFQIAKMTAKVLACSSRALRSNGLHDTALLTRYLHACDLFTNNDDASATANAFQLFSTLRAVIQGAPDFVPARTDLAKFEAFLAPEMPPETATALRQDASKVADEALRLQPDAPDALLAKEMVMPTTDWAAREAMLRKAVAADPDWPHTNGFLAFLLQDTGRIQEAKVFAAKAAAADLQIDWAPWGAQLACDAGDYDPATSDAEQALKNQPKDSAAKSILRGCLIDAKRFADARRLDPPSLSPDPEYAYPNLRIRVLTALETKSPADREAARQAALALGKTDLDHRFYAITMLSLLGDVDDAFSLAGGLTAGDPGDSNNYLMFLFRPPNENLRRDPRFMQLAARFKLLQFWKASGKWPDFCAERDLPYNCRTAK